MSSRCLPLQNRVVTQGIQEFKTAQALLKAEGFRALFRRYGWKIVAAIFCYYLVRDLTLYVVIPLVILRWF